MWLWGQKKNKDFHPEEIMKKHLSEEEIEKLKDMDNLYAGVTNSIENSINLSSRFTVKGIINEVEEAVEECGNKEKCPVHRKTEELCKECEKCSNSECVNYIRKEKELC